MLTIIFLVVIGSVAGVEDIFPSEKFFPSDIYKEEISARIENRPNSNEPVRRFLKSYNSLRPVALLVDDTKESLGSAIDFMKDVFKIAPGAQKITFFVSKFNSTGTTTLAEVPGTAPETIFQNLNSKVLKQNSELGHVKSTGTLAFYATLNAASALPQDAAIVMFIDRKINDEDLAGHTAIVRKKNIKVYVLWGGLYPTKTNEERLLKELCSYSGGLFLVNTIKDLSTYNYRGFINNNSTNNMSVILTKTNISSNSTYTFPIDSEVTCIHLIISPSTSKGTLTTPTGEHVDIEDSDSIAAYGTGSFGITEQRHREVYLDATHANDAAVGLWQIDVRASTWSVPCNITVLVCTRLIAQAYYIRESTDNYVNNKRKLLKVDFIGHLGTVNNVTLIDRKGNFLKNKIKYDEIKDFLAMETDNNKKEIDIEVNNISQKPYQVFIQGTDKNGNQFSRYTYVTDQNYNNILPQPILTIDVGLSSELIITGGRSSIITFEVTNLGNTAVDTRFYCSDERSILGSMQPIRSIISPQETTVVTLVLATRTGVYQDLITFKANELEKKVIVDVGTQFSSDTTPPSLDYTYLSDCSKVIFKSCDQGTWTIEVGAKDTGSGLLQVSSIPKGIYFQNGFTTGTKEQVTGTYSDSCCNADLQLIAIDRAKNRRTITPNAYRATWGPGQIAALVLGIILFILIILIIVYLVRRCIKKREIYNLPTYRGGGI